MGPISPRRLCRRGRIGANIGVRSAIDLAHCPFGLERGAEALRGRVVPSCSQFAFDLYGSLGLELHAFRLGQRSKSVKMFCRPPPPWSRTTRHARDAGDAGVLDLCSVAPWPLSLAP